MHSVLTISSQQKFRHDRLKVFADNNLNVVYNYVVDNYEVDKAGTCSFNRIENILIKGKELVCSIFSFTHNVFKIHFCQGCENSE